MPTSRAECAHLSVEEVSFQVGAHRPYHGYACFDCETVMSDPPAWYANRPLDFTELIKELALLKSGSSL